MYGKKLMQAATVALCLVSLNALAAQDFSTLDTAELMQLKPNEMGEEDRNAFRGDASNVAHGKLGLTPEMQKMCSMFGDEKFREMGFAFHKSGDDLGDALKTRDVATSLRALNKTMEYCVSCHATYRQ